MNRYIREAECRTITGLSRTTRWRLEQTGDFPQRRVISTGLVAWLLSEVMEWLESREVRDRNHPLKNWAEVKSAKIEAINNPGPKGEPGLIKALNFQKHGKDAKKFSEAVAAESQTWGRRK